MSASVTGPIIHGRRVLLPTTWSCFAWATLDDPSSPPCAVELSRQVLDAAETSAAAEPTPDLIVEAFS